MILPTFLIIGAQKAGTTALYSMLETQQEIFMSPIKEPHFFTYMGETKPQKGYGKQRTPIIRDIETYSNLFGAGSNFSAIGEASPSYIYSPEAPERIRNTIPEVKLIAILRNPVDRAFSNYIHCRRTNREPIDNFRDAIIAEDRRISDGWGFLWHYKRKGYYTTQLKRYFSLFDRHQILVLEHRDFSTDQEGSLAKVMEFLDIESNLIVGKKMTYNVSGMPKNRIFSHLYSFYNQYANVAKKIVPYNIRKAGQRLILNKPTITIEDRIWLKAEYADEINQLEDLVGFDLNHWK